MNNQERLRPPPQAKLFFAVSWSRNAYHEVLHSRLTKRFGSLEEPSPIFSFSQYSTYYDGELGGPVWKYFVAVDPLHPADAIVPVKIFAEGIQRELSASFPQGRRRTVNIDPGYLNGWQVVLSTVKNHSHRVYLREGVFCEIALLYREKGFRPLPWTYQDYLSPLARDFFLETRLRYRRQLSGEAGSSSPSR